MTTHRIFEPERVRALAHPTRLDLLEYLRDVQEATATQCAEHTGESVASCSFHLRILGKYGYIERAEQHGREKPWRPAPGERWDMRPSTEISGSTSAAAGLAALTVAREGERLHRFLSQFEKEPVEWVDAVTVTTSSFWATAGEMAQLSRDIQALTDRFPPRNVDPNLRPAGARKGRLFATLNPDPSVEHE